MKKLRVGWSEGAFYARFRLPYMGKGPKSKLENKTRFAHYSQLRHPLSLSLES